MEEDFISLSFVSFFILVFLSGEFMRHLPIHPHLLQYNKSRPPPLPSYFVPMFSSICVYVCVDMIWFLGLV